MRIDGSFTEKGSGEKLRYFVKPSDRSGLFVATVGGKLALGDSLCVYDMEEAGATVPATLRHRVLSRHLVSDESNPGRFAIEGCKVDIEAMFLGGPRKEEGPVTIDSGFIFELTPPPNDLNRMN